MENINKELESKYDYLKDTLNSIYVNIQGQTKWTSNETMREDWRGYVSFSFIQSKWSKSTKILNEIELAAHDMLRDLQTDSLIHSMLEANKIIQTDISEEAQQDEELKNFWYSTVPDELYGKTYNLIDLFVQSEDLIENFENKIKNIIDIFEERNKV